MRVQENNYSPEPRSENVQSSGIATLRLSRVPIGTNVETTESSSLGLVLSSKLSHQNNNLSKKEIHAILPKTAHSLMGDHKGSRTVSPTGILKPTKQFSREQSCESMQSRLEKLRKEFKQPALPASRRK